MTSPKSHKAQFIMSRLPLAMCSFVACLSMHCLAGTPQGGIHVGSTVAISADNPTVPLAETWLDANPRDPKNMIAVSMAWDPLESTCRHASLSIL